MGINDEGGSSISSSSLGSQNALDFEFRDPSDWGSNPSSFNLSVSCFPHAEWVWRHLPGWIQLDKDEKPGARSLEHGQCSGRRARMIIAGFRNTRCACCLKHLLHFGGFLSYTERHFCTVLGEYLRLYYKISFFSFLSAVVAGSSWCILSAQRGLVNGCVNGRTEVSRLHGTVLLHHTFKGRLPRGTILL